MPRELVIQSLLAAVAVLAATSAWAITIETVPAGNPGNAGELSGEGAGALMPSWARSTTSTTSASTR